LTLPCCYVILSYTIEEGIKILEFTPEFKFIDRKILVLPAKAYDIISSKKFYKDYYVDQKGFPQYTNFGNHKRSEQEIKLYDILNNFYNNIMKNFMISINHSNAAFNWEWWFQVYEPNSQGFTPHCHTTPCKFTISWTHFIEPAETSNFCWYYNKDKIVPINEEKNEIVFFPGHFWHKVLPNNSNKNRITIAGNINVLESPGYIIED